jgi:His-Xaa-Ser system protein HxsD
MSPEPLTWQADDLGASATFLVDTAVYNKTAIFKTAYWYTERCYLFLSKPDDLPGSIRLELRPKKKLTRDELIVLCREFCNSLIDQQVRQDVIAETGPIRDSLLKKAFFEGKSTLDSKIQSADTHIPHAGDTYKEDRLRISRSTGTS